MKKILLSLCVTFFAVLVEKDVTMAQQQVFKLYSSAFLDNGNIPSKYTCNGENISMPLSWDGVPAGTKSFVLFMEDPDTPNGKIWDHWILFNIPTTMHRLQEGTHSLPEEVKEGKNSWSKLEYGGPCPPDKEHKYIFSLLALDTMLVLPLGSTKQDIQKAIQNHILGRAEFIGRYDRNK